MKKNLMTAGAVAAGLVLMMAVASAQGPGQGFGPRGGGQGMGQGMGRQSGGPGGPMFGRGGGPRMMLAGLNLTNDQQAQVKSLMESERDVTQASARALAEARGALHAAIFANTVDTGAVAALQAKVAAAEQAQLAQEVQTQLAVAGILTPDQRAKMAARSGRGPGRGGPGRSR